MEAIGSHVSDCLCQSLLLGPPATQSPLLPSPSWLGPSAPFPADISPRPLQRRLYGGSRSLTSRGGKSEAAHGDEGHRQCGQGLVMGHRTQRSSCAWLPGVLPVLTLKPFPAAPLRLTQDLGVPGTGQRGGRFPHARLSSPLACCLTWGLTSLTLPGGQMGTVVVTSGGSRSNCMDTWHRPRYAAPGTYFVSSNVKSLLSLLGWVKGPQQTGLALSCGGAEGWLRGSQEARLDLGSTSQAVGFPQ